MAGVAEMPRRPKGQQSTSAQGSPIRISEKSLSLLRKLAGHLDRPMSDVASDLIAEHGSVLLHKLMLEEQERMKKEAK